jgi:hypothetical protein
LFLRFKSAKRTAENSPAIHRWECSWFIDPESAKRTAEQLPENRERHVLQVLSPASRASEYLGLLYPALKCWAIFNRPLRGR